MPYENDVSARDCALNGLAGLVADPPAMDLGGMASFDPDWLDGYTGLGPYNVWREPYPTPYTDAQARERACEYLLMVIDGIGNYIQIRQDTEPEYVNAELSSTAAALQAIADAAYQQYPPNTSSQGG